MMRTSVFRMLCCMMMAVYLATPRICAQEEMKTLRTVHLNVAFQAGVTQDDARRVADYLETDYDYLNRKLQIDLGKRLDVHLYDTEGKFLKGTQQSRASRGAMFFRGGLHIEPVKVLDNAKNLEQSLSFELSFLMLDSASAKGCPRWLREAFAVYHSGEMTELSPPSSTKLHYFSDLDEDIQQTPYPPQRDDVHYMLGMTMRFFVERFGEEKAFGVFKTFTGSQSTEDVFKNAFGAPFEEIEKAWSDYMSASTKRNEGKK